MQSNRSLLWFVIVGLVIVAAVYYFSFGPGKAPLPPPAATSAPVTPAAVPATAPVSAAETPIEPTAADITAAEAAKTLKQIEEDQQKEMMEKPSTPPAE